MTVDVTLFEVEEMREMISTSAWRQWIGQEDYDDVNGIDEERSGEEKRR